MQLMKRKADRTGTYESALNSLFHRIDELMDLRVGNERLENVILSKIIAAVRNERMCKPLGYQPPESVEEMKALFRGIAVEKNNERLMGGGEGTVEWLSHLVDRKYESSRRYREPNMPGYEARYSSRSPSPIGRYPVSNGGRSRSVSPRGRRNVPLTFPDGTVIRPSQCIICRKDGCHSSNHQRAAKAFLAAIGEEDFSNEEEGVQTEQGESREGREPDSIHASTSIVSYVADARVSARLGIPQTGHLGFVGMVIRTGTSLLSTVGEQWLPTINLILGKTVRIRRQPEDFVSIGGVGAISIQTSGSVNSPFLFGFQLHHARVYLVPDISPLLLSHCDMDNFGISYHSLEKRLIRPEDGY